MWGHVRGWLQDPEELRADLERVIELERRGERRNPEQDAKAWLDELARVDRKRSAYQDQQAEGLITLNELRGKLAELSETRQAAERELAILANRRERIVELERSKEAVLEHYAAIAPQALDALTSGERRRLYGLLRLEGVLHPDGNPEVSLPFGAGVSVPESTCSGTCSSLRDGARPHPVLGVRPAVLRGESPSLLLRVLRDHRGAAGQGAHHAREVLQFGGNDEELVRRAFGHLG